MDLFFLLFRRHPPPLHINILHTASTRTTRPSRLHFLAAGFFPAAGAAAALPLSSFFGAAAFSFPFSPFFSPAPFFPPFPFPFPLAAAAAAACSCSCLALRARA